MRFNLILVVIALVLGPLGMLIMGLVAHRLARWWALTSDKRTLRRIHKLKQELDRLQTIRLHQMLVPVGGFMLLIVYAITLMISTAYVSLVLYFRIHDTDSLARPQISLTTLRILRATPLWIGVAVSLYATWFVRRYWLRLPAYRKQVEREIAMLETSLGPGVLLE